MNTDIQNAGPEENETTVDRPLKVLLANRGNPDFGQNPGHRMPGTPRDRWATAADLAEASRLCLAYIAKHSLGGGNWTGGEILDAATREIIAYVSYNGKVWDGGRDSDIEIPTGE